MLDKRDENLSWDAQETQSVMLETLAREINVNCPNQKVDPILKWEGLIILW